MKRLTRSKEHKVFGGVLGGLGDYFDVDPVIFRLVFVLLLIATGLFPGVLVYLIAYVIIPEEILITPSKPVDDSPKV